jgi:hypothetical protein
MSYSMVSRVGQFATAQPTPGRSPMLFILVMEVLGAMFRKADEWNLLHPLGVRQIKQRVSLYTNDIMVFLSPTVEDLKLSHNIFDLFERATGLVCNMSKCQLAPIRCDDGQLSFATSILPCQVVNFPIIYLGIPLSVSKLPRSSWWQLIDRVVHKLPVWKGALMHKSGRLTLIKTTPATIPMHTDISVELPGWVCKALIKIMRAFLWSDIEPIQSGKCAIAWLQVQWPLHMGDLGVPDLRLMALSLQLRWLWFEHADSARVAIHSADKVDAISKAFFDASIICSIENGVSTLFWEDPWLDGHYIAVLAPNLVEMVSQRNSRWRTVQQALHDSTWIADISGALTIPVLVQYIQLRVRLQQVTPQPDASDSIT